MNKVKMILMAALTCGLLVGCASNPKVTQSVVKNTVQLGVAFGVEQAPEAITYLRYAAPVVCEAAKGTNVSPDYVIAQLQANEQANSVKNPQAVMIFNSAFGIYSGLYEEYGANEVQSRATLQAWLSGVCEGILAGLPSTERAARAKPLPAHLK